jgi:hypothetical protein
MPRLSLYKPEKGNDFKYFDKVILEMFQVGGTDFFIHKYLGPKNTPIAEATPEMPHYDVVTETNIQDILFLENRDRMYDPSIFILRGHYNIQDLDYNLMQFGIFLDNDTVYATLHIKNCIDTLGRRIIPGDVVELPHLVDDYGIGEHNFSLKRFYVVEDVNRAAEGFSQSWWPHLYRLKMKPITASQEFKDILDLPADEDQDPTDPTTIGDVISTGDIYDEINNAVIAEAEVNTRLSGYEVQHLFTLSVDRDLGLVSLELADQTNNTCDSTATDASEVLKEPVKEGYSGYLLGDGIPPNGAPFGYGDIFPRSADDGDFFLRLDFKPNRLFRFNGRSWCKYEDAIRHTLTNTDTRNTQKTGFINNTKINNISGTDVVERQAIAKALKPRADF